MSRKKQKKLAKMKSLTYSVEKFHNHSGKLVQKPSQNVDKSTQECGKTVQKPINTVQNHTKNVEKDQSSCGKPVDNSSQTVDNLHSNCGNPVDNNDKSVGNYPATCGKNVENNNDSVQKSQNTVENPASSCVKPVDNPSKTCAKIVENPASTVIKVENLYKSFRLPTERAAGLKQAIFNRLKGVKGFTEHQVLKGISFEVHSGEFIGIVGRNGSGKSTLLKLLAQIYHPEQGTIQIQGTLVPFIELGVGFNPELTGRENVYLNGALLGFSRKEMDAMYAEIVQFAELESFMDAKLKNFSSGMQVRLAFSIAIRARGDILILDEVLAVGDAEFQKKCNDYFASLHGEQTVILVTHSMENVRRFCDRAILIEDGQIMAEGAPDKVAQAYERLWD